LEDKRQPHFVRYLLAGRCLAEKVTIEPALRQQVLDGLRSYLRPPAASDTQTVDDLLYHVGGEKNLDWLIGNFPEQLTEAEKARLVASTNISSAKYILVQNALLRIMQEASDPMTRHTAGCVLSGIGDPRDLDELVEVPAGVFLMGSDKTKDELAYGDEEPQHTRTLPAYRIGKYPVTNGQYAAFVAATGHAAPSHWRGNQPPPELRNHPVVNVTWHDAVDYCVWLSQAVGREMRLPTEAEWERAARHTDGRIYPWDNDFDAGRCNMADTGIGGTSPVGIFPAGDAVCGAADMAGNVWEWTSSLWGKDWQKPEFGYPYDATDGRENLNAPDAVLRTLRGGSFRSIARLVRCAYRRVQS